MQSAAAQLSQDRNVTRVGVSTREIEFGGQRVRARLVCWWDCALFQNNQRHLLANHHVRGDS